ncbi:MAG: glycosyltransferase family A protein [bacterium]|nr:glycosyltransferase family A protein [bacterium]
MSPRFTVIIPTYDHGETLYYSVRSVVEQQIPDFELFIIGDGATPETGRVARELAALDRRISFIEYPKHHRRGEPYRHEILTKRARGSFVCYLCDDDLWLPNHLEYMEQLLQKADFAHPVASFVDAYGQVQVRPFTLQEPFYREMMLQGENRIGLSSMAHTLDFYKRLPHGWRTTPPGQLTDLYMYQQFLSYPGVVAASGKKLTLLNFPDGLRMHLSREQKLAELKLWFSKIHDSGFERELNERLFTAAYQKAIDLERTLTPKLLDVIWQRDQEIKSAHAYKNHAESLERAIKQTPAQST